jgi:CDP-4-dehydro-6-deoxyglucose reductase
VLWGGRRPEDHYLAASDLSDAYPYLPVLSRPAGAATGATGYIQDVLLRAMPDLTRATVYACGSGAMIQAARARLAAAGLQLGAFHAEAFVRSGTT